MNVINISRPGLLSGYLLLLLPLGISLWLKAGLVNRTILAVVRMTVQLFLVGLYLQFIFRLNNAWLSTAWMIVMVLVADVSSLHNCGLRCGRFGTPVFGAIAIGGLVPLAVLLGLVLRLPNLTEAQYMIPLCGMILGNGLRANVVGLRTFYNTLREQEKTFQHALTQGADLHEAVSPYIRDAWKAALAPTIATIATIGLVALPGMMTGVMLGGAAPLVAIKYQVCIMLAILAGTSLTVLLSLRLTVRRAFTAWGVLDQTIFR